MIPDITINQKTLQQMTDQVLSPLDSALANVILETATPCVKAAQAFLTSIQKGYEELTAANILARKQYQLQMAMKNPDNDIISLSNEYQRNKQVLNEMYMRSQVVDINIKMEEFSKELNNFLNQKTQLTYVYTNDNGQNPVILLVDDISQIMYKDMGSKGAGIKARIDMSKEQAKIAMDGANATIRKLATENYMTKRQVKNLKGSYNEVIFRYNTYNYKVKKGKNKSKTVRVILWKPEIDWKIVIMGDNNRGDIKEAYVNALINRTGFLSKEQEKNIDDFMSYVSQVDAVPGMLQGDVSEQLADGSTIEYAVKGTKASFMSLELAVKLAIEILTAQPPFDIQALKKKKIEYAKDILPRNRQVTLSVLEQLFEDNIPDTLNAIINI